MPPHASSAARAMRQRSSGCSATGSSDASWPQYSNSRRGARCAARSSSARVVRAEPAEQRQVVRALEHVDRVDLQQRRRGRARRRSARRRARPPGAGRRSPAPPARCGAPGRRRGARRGGGGRRASAAHPARRRVEAGVVGYQTRARRPAAYQGSEDGGTRMTSPAAEAAADRPRRRLYTQLWFSCWSPSPRASPSASSSRSPAEKAKWLADAFIQLIQTITGPVIFVTVVLGIASIGNLARAGGLAAAALAYFFSMTVIALALGPDRRQPRQARQRVRGQASEASRADAKAQIDEAGATGPRPLHHRRPAAGVVRGAVRGERDPARARHRAARRRGRLLPRRPRAARRWWACSRCCRGSSSASSA